MPTLVNSTSHSPNRSSKHTVSYFRSYISFKLNLYSVLPADPAVYHIANSNVTIRLSHYGRRLDRADVLSCLLQATTTVISEINKGSETLIGKTEVQSSSNRVYLILHSSDSLTWGMWGSALKGLMDFVERFEFVDLDFEIIERYISEVVGSGLLVYI